MRQPVTDRGSVLCASNMRRPSELQCGGAVHEKPGIGAQDTGRVGLHFRRPNNTELNALRSTLLMANLPLAVPVCHTPACLTHLTCQVAALALLQQIRLSYIAFCVPESLSTKNPVRKEGLRCLEWRPHLPFPSFLGAPLPLCSLIV